MSDTHRAHPRYVIWRQPGTGDYRYIVYDRERDTPVTPEPTTRPAALIIAKHLNGPDNPNHQHEERQH
jgi:hypothetical protein